MGFWRTTLDMMLTGQVPEYEQPFVSGMESGELVFRDGMGGEPVLSFNLGTGEYRYRYWSFRQRIPSRGQAGKEIKEIRAWEEIVISPIPHSDFENIYDYYNLQFLFRSGSSVDLKNMPPHKWSAAVANAKELSKTLAIRFEHVRYTTRKGFFGYRDATTVSKYP